VSNLLDAQPLQVVKFNIATVHCQGSFQGFDPPFVYLFSCFLGKFIDKLLTKKNQASKMVYKDSVGYLAKISIFVYLAAPQSNIFT